MSFSTNNQNHYEVLGVSVDSPLESIRRSWLLRIKKYHPDNILLKNEEGRLEQEKKAVQINNAWDILKDDKKRYKYDIENELRVAKCGLCGNEGRLRAKNNNVLALCDNCNTK